MPSDADLETIDTAITNAASKPASASQDGGSVTLQSADDQLKRAAYAQQQGITVSQLFNQRTRLVNGPRQ